MGRRKLSRAEKMRRFITANPHATVKDLADVFKTTYQIAYMVKRNMEGKALKKPKVTKEMMQSVVDDLRAKRKEKINPLDTMPKVGDTVGGLTLTRAEKDGQYQYRWVRQAPELPITMEEPKSDPVNHPAHYKAGGIETIDFIEAKGLNYRLGNVVKYITRADHKGNRKQDLEKAMWYLKREIEENSKPT